MSGLRAGKGKKSELMGCFLEIKPYTANEHKMIKINIVSTHLWPVYEDHAADGIGKMGFLRLPQTLLHWCS